MTGPTSTKSSKDKIAEQAEVRSQEQVRQPALSGPLADILTLQHTVGNRAVGQLLRQLLQPGTGGRPSPTDVEGQVETVSTSSLKPLPSAASSPADAKGLPPTVRSLLNSSGGQPLDPTTRAFMESRFGYDFSPVRVHTGTRADGSVREVNALAYTVGRDVVFGDGGYSPGTMVGKELLAHELAHTIQQTPRTQKTPPLSPNSTFETAAHTASRGVVRGQCVAGTQPASGVGLARAPVTPGGYTDEQLIHEINVVNARINARGKKEAEEQTSYEGQEADQRWLSELMDVASTRNIDPSELVSRPPEVGQDIERARREAPSTEDPRLQDPETRRERYVKLGKRLGKPIDYPGRESDEADFYAIEAAYLTEAESKRPPYFGLKPDPNAFRGIEIGYNVNTIPPAFVKGERVFERGKYQFALHHNPDDPSKAMYYAVVRTEKGYFGGVPKDRPIEYIVGPESIQEFLDDLDYYTGIAAVAYMGGQPSSHQIEAARMIEHLMEGRREAAFYAWGSSWEAARDDPQWWFDFIASVATSAPAGVAGRTAAVGPARVAPKPPSSGFLGKLSEARGLGPRLAKEIQKGAARVQENFKNPGGPLGAKPQRPAIVQPGVRESLPTPTSPAPRVRPTQTPRSTSAQPASQAKQVSPPKVSAKKPPAAAPKKTTPQPPKAGPKKVNPSVSKGTALAKKKGYRKAEPGYHWAVVGSQLVYRRNPGNPGPQRVYNPETNTFENKQIPVTSAQIAQEAGRVQEQVVSEITEWPKNEKSHSTSFGNRKPDYLVKKDPQTGRWVTADTPEEALFAADSKYYDQSTVYPTDQIKGFIEIASKTNPPSGKKFLILVTNKTAKISEEIINEGKKHGVTVLQVKQKRSL